MVTAAEIAAAVREAIPRVATELRPDARAAIVSALETERSQRARAVLEQLIENDRVARGDRVPLCQDTGTVWVLVEAGADEGVAGDVQAECDRAVAEAFRTAGLRMSTVADALLDRTNRGDNGPAFVDIALRPGRGATVHVMLKGGGSDNASRTVMLPPGAGWDGVKSVVVEAVEQKASSACPPLLIGVGVGGTFDKVAGLAKKALLRPIGSTATDPRLEPLEAELLDAVNATGIGPGGLGGDTTALAVHIVSAPCHIAALPVAVNLGCIAVRSATIEIPADG